MLFISIINVTTEIFLAAAKTSASANATNSKRQVKPRSSQLSITNAEVVCCTSYY